jgi:hypothetical protein
MPSPLPACLCSQPVSPNACHSQCLFSQCLPFSTGVHDASYAELRYMYQNYPSVVELVARRLLAMPCLLYYVLHNSYLNRISACVGGLSPTVCVRSLPSSKLRERKAIFAGCITLRTVSGVQATGWARCYHPQPHSRLKAQGRTCHICICTLILDCSV